MKIYKSIFCLQLQLSIFISGISSLHIKGTWQTKSYYIFLAKFGIQKTDAKDKDNTEGFIYGNITTKNKSVQHPLTFVFVDSEYFLEYHGNSTSSSPGTCNAMFNKIDKIAFDRRCKPNGKEDFLRHIPCPEGKLCQDEDEPSNVMPGYQFTYRVLDLKYPR